MRDEKSNNGMGVGSNIKKILLTYLLITYLPTTYLPIGYPACCLNNIKDLFECNDLTAA